MVAADIYKYYFINSIATFVCDIKKWNSQWIEQTEKNNRVTGTYIMYSHAMRAV